MMQALMDSVDVSTPPTARSSCCDRTLGGGDAA